MLPQRATMVCRSNTWFRNNHLGSATITREPRHMQQFHARIRTRRGFTLVELAVVIVIIGVLAAFGVPKFLNSVEEVEGCGSLQLPLRDSVGSGAVHRAEWCLRQCDHQSRHHAPGPAVLHRGQHHAVHQLNRCSWLVARARPELEFELFLQRRLDLQDGFGHDQLDDHDLSVDLPGDDQLRQQW